MKPRQDIHRIYTNPAKLPSHGNFLAFFSVSGELQVTLASPHQSILL